MLLEEKDLSKVFPLQVQRHATLFAHHIERECVVIVLETLLADAHARSEGLDEARLGCESALACVDIGQSRYRINFSIDEHDKLGAGLAHLTDDVTWFVHIKAEPLDKHLNRSFVDIIEYLELVLEV